MFRQAHIAACMGAVSIFAVASQAQTFNSAATQDLLKALEPRNLGPTVMGGRISSLAVYEKNPAVFYIGTASGGLWKTTNAGMTAECVFQYEKSVALGAVAIDQDDPNIIWVGTGEQNSRNSTLFGDGVYMSKDSGKNWTHMGLSETMHISKIFLHPKNKNVIFVGALGHLWGANEERGLYKSEDGGKSWDKIFYVNDKTGVIDLDVDPSNPDIMYMATWERFRWPYRWASGGPGSGLYKSTDGGDTWKKIQNGFPKGDIGRIGIDIQRSNPKNLVALIEASVPGEKEGEREATGGFYISKDGGASWTKQSDNNPRPFYFSLPKIDPVDANRVYVNGVSMTYSDDAGKTWKEIAESIHSDHHAMWINPNNPNHIIGGNDGGVSQSFDRGESWEHVMSLAIGQFYMLGYDMRKPYWVYGGLQDNGTWGGPTQTIDGGVSAHHWHFINGGDGFHVQVDPTDWRIVYAESQGGSMARHNIETGDTSFIRRNIPRETGLRFNWSTPIVLSPHNPKTIWVGSQYLYKSVDMGEHFVKVSPDLTTNDPEKLKSRAGVTPEDTGAERHCTIITISESPIKPDMVWVGTDDGNIQLTRDGGDTWENVTGNLPKEVPDHTWVSRVTASQYEEGRAYITLDGHRTDDFTPYIYVTEDYGKTWKSLVDPATFHTNDSCYEIIEGTENPNLLIVGTEMGLYFSMDRGASWTKYHRSNGFPTVRVDDLAIHPREKDLIVATHGRSIWIIPIGPLEQMTGETAEQDVALLDSGTIYGLGKVFRGWFGGDRGWMSRNTQPAGNIYYYLKEATEEKITVEVFDARGRRLANLDGKGAKGLNMVQWRPNSRQMPDQDETFRVVMKVGDKEYTSTIRFENLAQEIGH